VDAEGRIAYKLRWNTNKPGEKCSWAQDPDNKRPGLGAATPTLYHLEELGAGAVIITEGERDADTVSAWLGELHLAAAIATTCTPHGAADVKPEYLSPLTGKEQVWVSGDNDTAGKGYAERCADLLTRQVQVLRVLHVPDGAKDWSDWAEAGGSAQAFGALLEQADLIRPPNRGSSDETKCGPAFNPLPLEQLLDEPYTAIPWIVHGYSARGRWTHFAGPPKIGKTSLAQDFMKAVTLGRPWIGRSTHKGKVLLLNLEEHGDDVVDRFRDEDLPEGQIKIHRGRLPYTPEVLAQIVEYVETQDIALVVIDTLPKWFGLDDENHASELLREGTPLLDAIRQTKAGWISIGHTRKGGGGHGEAIRGTNALVGLVDIALTLKRTEAGGFQRCLEAVSRYSETPDKIIISMGEHGYEVLGSPEEVFIQGKTEKVKAALTGGGQTMEDLKAKTGLSKQDVSRCLQRLGDGVLRKGTGKRNDRFRFFWKELIRPGSFSYTDETSPEQNTTRFVQPPVPSDETNQETIDCAG
jgi:hypothetical protein